MDTAIGITLTLVILAPAAYGVFLLYRWLGLFDPHEYYKEPKL